MALKGEQSCFFCRSATVTDASFDRMIEAVAGPRGRNFSQGRVGGVLKELGFTEKEVVKL